MNQVLPNAGVEAAVEKSPIDRYSELKNGLSSLQGEAKKGALDQMKAILKVLTEEVDGEIKNLAAEPDHSKIVEDLAITEAIANIRKGPVRRFFDRVFGKGVVGEDVDLSHFYVEMNDFVAAANEKPEDVNKILGVAEKVAVSLGYNSSDKGQVHYLWKAEFNKLVAVVSHFVSKDVDANVLKSAVDDFVKFSENWMMHLNKSLEEAPNAAVAEKVA